MAGARGATSLPAVINIAGNLALGGALTLVVSRSPALRRDFVNWAFLMLMAFEAVIFTPSATYLFRFYPQWSMLYWFDPQIFPELESFIGVLSLAAVLLNFAAVVLGYTLARAGVLHSDRRLAYAPLVAAAMLIIAVLTMYYDRVALIGDYDMFWQGNAVVLFKRVAGWVGVLSYVGAGLFVFFVHRRFHDHDPSLV
jgi:hypothetical protein